MAEDGAAALRPLVYLLSLCLGQQPGGSTEDPEYEMRVFGPS